uniref:Clathrin/coatomer adaptor adaptin-like N-terminal domain-containing protein n=1 Tax=Trichogramma kaykai TaxID=54128 RepID=A0ABD2W0F7_9HYME
MSKEARDKTLLMAVNRILTTKKSIVREGVDIRMKILTTLAAVNPCVKEAVIRYVTNNIRSRIELAFSWLYEECALLQGFQWCTSLCLMTPEVLHQAYNDFLIKLVPSIQNVDGEDRNSLLSRVYLEAPLITEDAVKALKTISSDGTWRLAPLQLLKELVIKRPTKQHAFLNILLCHTKHNNSTIRENAIILLIELNAHPELTKMIKEHSVLQHIHL